MKKTIQFIAIAILAGISFLNVSAQEQTNVTNTEESATTAKVEKKVVVQKQSSNDDSWTGFYVGGYGGYTNGRASANTSTVTTSGGFYGDTTTALINTVGTQRIKSNGFSGGGTVGYNYQKGKFFVGGEFDFGTNRINNSTSGTAKYAGDPSRLTITQSVKTNWMMTARHRGGIALKKVLLYVSGGVALTDIKYAGNFAESFDNFGSATESGSFKKTKAGWTTGAGMEIKIVNRWSVKGEYLFSQFGRTLITSTNFQRGQFAVPPFYHSTDLKTHNVRFGINYRF